jgi:hypothetical protein
MTSNCQNCGNAKTVDMYANDYCQDCISAVAGAEAEAVAQNGDTASARRAALSARAHSANRNFTDPRLLDRRTIWNYGNAQHAIPGAQKAAEAADKQ